MQGPGLRPTKAVAVAVAEAAAGPWSQGCLVSHLSSLAAPRAGGFLALDWCDSSPVGPLARRSFALHASLADSLGIETGYRRMRTHSISVKQGQAGGEGACAGERDARWPPDIAVERSAMRPATCSAFIHSFCC